MKLLVVLSLLFGFLNILNTSAFCNRKNPIALKAYHQRFGNLKLSPIDTIVIDNNFNLAGGTLVLGTIFGALENLKEIETDKNNAILEATKFLFAKLFGALAVFLTVFGLFFAYQTNDLRFIFDKDSFSLVKADGSSTGENVAVGGANSWKYSSFLNYDFLPNEDFPILVYFKENQTPESAWVEAPIIVDQLKGQQHFFPCIANSQQLKENFLSHNCKRVDSKPVTFSNQRSKEGSKLVVF